MSTHEISLAALRRFAETRLGLNLARGGSAQALARHATQLGSEAAPQLDAIRGDLDSPSFQALVRAVTVQHSWFFRDAQQLEAAVATLHPGARIWIPACAKGEEAYSIAALCQGSVSVNEILGTDVCGQALEQARRASYDAWSTREVPARFAPLFVGHPTRREVSEPLRRQVRFLLHNLLDPPPLSASADGKWDLILCRNVLIYLSPAHSARVVAALRDSLTEGGGLVLGASDILTEIPAGLTPVTTDGRVIFRRLASVARASPPNAAALARDLAPPPAQPLPQTPTRRQSPRIPPTPRREAVFPASNSWQQATATPTHPAALPTDSDLAITFDADIAMTHLFEGIERYLAGDLALAVKELRAALYHLPHCWPASYYLALTHDLQGRRDEARREFAQVVRLISASGSLPEICGHDFAFLAHDVATIARRRAD